MAVDEAVVYVAQKAAAVPDEAVKTDAQASFLGPWHARIAGTIAPKKRSVERMIASIQMKIMSSKESQRANCTGRSRKE